MKLEKNIEDEIISKRTNGWSLAQISQWLTKRGILGGQEANLSVFFQNNHIYPVKEKINNDDKPVFESGLKVLRKHLEIKARELQESGDLTKMKAYSGVLAEYKKLSTTTKTADAVNQTELQRNYDLMKNALLALIKHKKLVLSIEQFISLHENEMYRLDGMEIKTTMEQDIELIRLPQMEEMKNERQI